MFSLQIQNPLPPASTDLYSSDLHVYKFLHVLFFQQPQVITHMHASGAHAPLPGMTPTPIRPLSTTFSMYLSGTTPLSFGRQPQANKTTPIQASLITPTCPPLYSCICPVYLSRQPQANKDDTHTDNFTHHTYLSTTFSMYLLSTTALSFGRQPQANKMTPTQTSLISPTCLQPSPCICPAQQHCLSAHSRR